MESEAKKAALIVVISLIFIAGFLFLRSRQQRIGVPLPFDKEGGKVGWHLYENRLHNLSFQYPIGWQLEEIADEPQFLSVVLKKEDISQERVSVSDGEKIMPVYSINIRVNKNSKKLSVKNYYLSQFATSSRAQAEKKIEELTVAGRPAIKYLEGSAPASGPSTIVLVATEDKIYSFSYSALAKKETHEKFLDQFNLLLTTVKISD